MDNQNIICPEEDELCLLCSIGEDLKEDMLCLYDHLRIGNSCPGFQCTEQCRECPKECIHLSK
jgi:hypothetical protein